MAKWGSFNLVLVSAPRQCSSLVWMVQSNAGQMASVCLYSAATSEALDFFRLPAGEQGRGHGERAQLLLRAPQGKGLALERPSPFRWTNHTARSVGLITIISPLVECKQDFPKPAWQSLQGRGW